MAEGDPGCGGIDCGARTGDRGNYLVEPDTTRSSGGTPPRTVCQLRRSFASRPWSDCNLPRWSPHCICWPQRQIYVRGIDEFEARPLVGTEDSMSLSFSPDGEWISYISGYPSAATV